MEGVLMWGLIPPILLVIYMFHLDKIEREPVGLIIKTFIFGMLSCIPAVIMEILLGDVLDYVYPGYTEGLLYIFIFNFFVVAFSEEFSKRMMANLSVWRNPQFNFHFDAIIYYTTSALGFAAAENILYMTQFGTEIAISRMIPVHTICGIFMGYFMGWAKTAELDNQPQRCSRYKKAGLLVPMLVHGTWDFCLSTQSVAAVLFVYVMIVVLTVYAARMMHREARKDSPI